jgi:undecaprenyl diphosphate synthase
MDKNSMPKSIAIIMDGNRRWAREHGLATALGHKKGAEVLENTARYCNKIGIESLIVYAFSTENWKRTKEEVTAILSLLNRYLDKFLEDAHLDNIKLHMIGDIDSLPDALKNKMYKMEERTKNNTGLKFNIAFNYGGRAEIVRACKLIAQDVLDGKTKIKDIDEDMFSNNLYTKGLPDPDLVIRTSGELRTSNFLPWQITYSEFLFLQKYWPDFTNDDVDKACEEYSKRQRRKGK